MTVELSNSIEIQINNKCLSIFELFFFLTAQFYQLLFKTKSRVEKKRPEMKTICEEGPKRVNKILFGHSSSVQCAWSQLFAVINTTKHILCEKKVGFRAVTQGKGVQLPRGVLQT